MQSLDDEERRMVLGEVLADELKVIREYVQDIPYIREDVEVLKIDMSQLKSDMAVMKALYKGHDGQLNDHERRIAGLETAG